MTCAHTVTQGREGHDGYWCAACGEKVSDVDRRPCGQCHHFAYVFGGAVCKKHLMAVAATMRVTFKISKGSCWTEK